MTWFFDLITNPIIVAGVTAWFNAQVLKTIIYWVVNKKFDIFMLLDIILMLVFTIFTVNIWTDHVDQALMLNGVFKKIISSNLGSSVSMRSLFVIRDKSLIFSCITGLLLTNAIFKNPKYDIQESNPSIDKHMNLIRARFVIGVAIWVIPSLICWAACLA